MKKLLFAVLALAIATPVWAGSVTLTDEGSGLVRVDYTMTSGEKRVRAFGIDVVFATASPQPTITAISNYKTNGASTSLSKGYGIFPSNIVIDGNGLFVSSGSPVSPNSKLPTGTQGGLNTKGVTLEFGSLFAPTTSDANAPLLNTGGTITLCKLQCAGNGAASGLLSITPNTARGGIVNEDTTAASPTLATNVTVTFAVPVPPNAPTNIIATRTLLDKVTVQWTAPTGTVTGYDVYRATTNVPGGTKIGLNVAGSPWDDTTAVAGTMYYYYVKAKNSVGDSAYSIYDTVTAACVGIRAKASWANTRWDMSSTKCPGQYRGDSDCSGAVNAIDLNALKSSWLKSFASGSPPYKCGANFNHDASGVNAVDLNILKLNWLKSGLGGQGTTLTACPATE